MKFAIVHNLPPGGQKRALYEQVKRLSGKHTLDLFTLSLTDDTFLPLKPFIRNHHKVEYDYPDHFPMTLLSIMTDLKEAYRKMAKMIDKGKYDAVFVSPCFLTQSPYILRFLKTPSLYYCPEPKREFYERIPHVSNNLAYSVTYPFRLPIKKIDRDNARHATKIATNSAYSGKKIMEAYGIEPLVNYLGVDTKMFRPVNIPKENWVLSVGSLSLHKGHDFIIRSLSLISKEVRPDFIIVSQGGQEMKYLLKYAKSLSVNLVILNNIKDGELAEIYNRSKIYISGAINEPFGLSILEAISCGTYALAVDEGGVREIITDDKMGILVNRIDMKIGNLIQEILKRVQDDKKKHIRHEWVEKNWNWEKSVDKLSALLQEVSKVASSL